MSKYSDCNTENPWNTFAKTMMAVRRFEEKNERDRLARLRRARQIQIIKLTIKVLFLLALVSACCFLVINNMDYIKALIAKPLLPKHWSIDVSHYFSLVNHWLQWHIDALWNWVITTGDKHGCWGIATLIFLASWRIVRWIDDDEMTLLEFVWFLFKCALVIAIFAALLYGAIIFIALAALAICGPLVAGGVVRPAVNHRMRW